MRRRELDDELAAALDGGDVGDPPGTLASFGSGPAT